MAFTETNVELPFEDADIELVALAASLNGSQGVGGVYELQPIPEQSRQICRTCTDLNQNVFSRDYRRVGLGNIPTILSRASHCEICRSIILACPMRLDDDNILDVSIRYQHSQGILSVYYRDLEIPLNEMTFSEEGNTLSLRWPEKYVYFLSETGRPDGGIGRPYEPNHFNLDLVRGWINCCHESHGEYCNSSAATQLNDAFSIPQGLRLIDVEQECVVRVPSIPDCGYLALSYERYLWVDALCIVQDDEVHKQSNLENMASIYLAASFTIVVAGGNGANAGIAGMGHDGGLRRGYHVLRFPSWTFTSAVRRGTELEVSPWAFRGWTFQERLFSRRLLVVNGTHGEISWVCQRAEWREEEWRPSERPSGVISQGQALVTPPREWGERISTTRFPIWPDLVAYSQMVTNYSTRALGNNSDISAAFAGVTTVLEHFFRCNFLHGLPEAFFDLALLWQPEFEICRRDESFPSWSWQGWIGRINYKLMLESTAELFRRRGLSIIMRSTVTWYIQSTTNCADSQRRQINSIWLSLIAPTRAENARTLPQALPLGWAETTMDGERTYTHTSAPGARFRHAIPYFWEYSLRATPRPTGRYISTRTERAWFKIGNIETPRSGPRFPHFPPRRPCTATLLDSNGNWAGTLEVNLLEAEAAQRDRACCEIIQISVGSTTSPEHAETTGHPLPYTTEWLSQWNENMGSGQSSYYFCNVLWIERIDGVAYRKALGVVPADVWGEQDPEQVDVVLG